MPAPVAAVAQPVHRWVARGFGVSGETRKWYDDVVAATRYIGPKSP